ncbi:hypothetical protein ZWY2020_054120 [Hordeum vulgare]|nr:hypothetical protein ZWY2020_054120 [Hordeum vulgare]
MCLQTEHHAAAMHNAYAAMDPYWHLMPEDPVEVKLPTAAPGFLRLPSYENLAYAVERACADVDGVVLNTFLELEPGTVVDCAEVRSVAVWAVGPVSLFHRHEHAAALAARGNVPALDADECMQWLDGKAPSRRHVSRSASCTRTRSRWWRSGSASRRRGTRSSGWYHHHRRRPTRTLTMRSAGSSRSWRPGSPATGF